jgi:hypothetical protein
VRGSSGRRPACPAASVSGGGKPGIAPDLEAQSLAGRALGGKRIEYLEGHRRSPVDAERHNVPCPDDAEVVELARLAKVPDPLPARA